jgi:motility quorum-sensing regulator/GCU-specific mRNA interferase toxin
VEKRKPHHDLPAFKKAFSTEKTLYMTLTAASDALALGCTRSKVVEVIQGMKSIHFYKSMTTQGDSTSWQDVYHVPWDEKTLYVKFTDDRITAFRVLSFKEK